MSKFLDDDSGQMFSGTAWLIVMLIAATVIFGISWIVFSPTLNTCFGFFNTWIAAGWVTDNGYWMMNILGIIWTALPALVFIGLMVHTEVRANVLKGMH